jgi:outer membrane protein insertion porin family
MSITIDNKRSLIRFHWRGILLLLVVVIFWRAPIACAQNIILRFEGNTKVTSDELRDQAGRCISQFSNSPGDVRLAYCLKELRSSLGARGYLRATVDEGERKVEANVLQILVHINEGPIYRLGKVKITGSSRFPDTRLREMLYLSEGEVANAEIISTWANVNIKKAYTTLGYIQFAAQTIPTFHPSQQGLSTGVVDLLLSIDEGDAFTVRSISFTGVEKSTESFLHDLMVLQSGHIFNSVLLEESLNRIKGSGEFQEIDHEKDIDYKWDEKTPLVDIVVHLKRKPQE